MGAICSRRRPHRRPNREIQRYRCGALSRLPSRDRPLGRQCCASLVLPAPPNIVPGNMALTLRGLGEFAAIGKRLWQNEALAARIAASAPIRRRHPRPVVRVRSDQGAAWLRRGRRQPRQPVQRGIRLCVAAPRIRRGERQGGHVGTCHRRHGRDHAGHGARRRRTRRAHRFRAARCAKSSSRRTAPPGWC